MRRLGIDHGTKRVGLALSDEEGWMAHARDTWKRDDADALLERLAAFVEAEEVGEIVVGLPLHLDGHEGASARRARRFSERLEQRTGLPVVLWDERMTSAAAERSLRDAGVKAKDQKGLVDQVAAALLLQSYLDSLRAREDRWDGPDAGAASATPSAPDEAADDEPSSGR